MKWIKNIIKKIKDSIALKKKLKNIIKKDPFIYK